MRFLLCRLFGHRGAAAYYDLGFCERCGDWWDE